MDREDIRFDPDPAECPDVPNGIIVPGRCQLYQSLVKIHRSLNVENIVKCPIA